jgi:RimJ/RimL family protein N-acetyltransferase
MTVMEIENSIGKCGLVCSLCSCKSNCSGCRSKNGDCSIKNCSLGKVLDPYDICPTYESQSFLLRLVSPDDAKDLLRCYSNSESQRFFNDDNCDFGYGNVDSLEKMQYNIKLWLDSYHTKNFIRFSIIDKSTDNAVGTVEMFGGKHGILRIDIMPEHECESRLSEFFETADRFFNDFNCDCIVSKAIPEAKERIKALKKCGYAPYPQSDTWSREHYYMKTQNRKIAK